MFSMLCILVILLSLSLLLPSSSTTNTAVIVMEKYRNLGQVKPPPCPAHYPSCHAPSGSGPPHNPPRGKYCPHPSHCY
ncbi:hypothetical protein ES319_A10G143000v1 [Gossypium barbadense]|uniref:Uncharacterized protein n=3 Tax=Gossypium TaxID=3633 RepID=A0A5J5U6S1_GOSBA|nr:hypothetical protein ES319_A10G143000v1 [Gossypium barbadense]TYG98960.1 hypothetical protein ES288_A10G159000v1 [Gossypium darwinii]TYI06415.1 hypothetical protein ES332_A10G158100v1 [Gossypium tomentosum]